MAVGRGDGEFAKSPWFVIGLMDADGAVRREFFKKRIDIFDKDMSEVRMIAGVAREHCIGTFAEHHLEIAEGQKFPPRNGEIAFETEAIQIIISLDRQIFNGENMTCMDHFWRCVHLSSSGELSSILRSLRPLKADVITVRIVQIELFHSVWRDLGRTKIAATFSQIFVGCIDIRTAKI